MFALALRMNMPVAILSRLMPASELVEWVAWFDLNDEQPDSETLTADQQYAQMRGVIG